MQMNMTAYTKVICKLWYSELEIGHIITWCIVDWNTLIVIQVWKSASFILLLYSNSQNLNNTNKAWRNNACWNRKMSIATEIDCHLNWLSVPILASSTSISPKDTRIAILALFNWEGKDQTCNRMAVGYPTLSKSMS